MINSLYHPLFSNWLYSSYHFATSPTRTFLIAISVFSSWKSKCPWNVFRFFIFINGENADYVHFVRMLEFSWNYWIFHLLRISFQGQNLRYITLRAPEKLILKLRALPSRFFLFQMCPHFFRGRFIWRPQNALSFFFYTEYLWALFFLEGEFI